MRHLLNVSDLTSEEILRIFALTADLKVKFRAGVRERLGHLNAEYFTLEYGFRRNAR